MASSGRAPVPIPNLESAVEERFVRASGPGGQNVNKVATAVELRLDLTRLDWPEDVLARLRAAAGTRLSADDVVVIHAREHRTQSRNRDAARERLHALAASAWRRPARRRRTRPSAASKQRRLIDKRRRAEVKRGRSTGGSE